MSCGARKKADHASTSAVSAGSVRKHLQTNVPCHCIVQT